ncbi:hypothetical protein D3C83_198350 [compost metagenome]
MEIVSSTLELVGLLTLAAYFGSPSARVAWARLQTRRKYELELKRPTDPFDER